jgi:hypothetical protein
MKAQRRLVTRSDGGHDKGRVYGYTVAQLAQMAGVHRNTADADIASGRLVPEDLVKAVAWVVDRRAKNFMNYRGSFCGENYPAEFESRGKRAYRLLAKGHHWRKVWKEVGVSTSMARLYARWNGLVWPPASISHDEARKMKRPPLGILVEPREE